MMDWSAWQSSLSSKANTSMNNITTAGKTTVAGWGMPDYTAGISANGIYSSESNAFTAPCDGVLIYQCYVISVGELYVDGVKQATVFGSNQGAGWTFPLVMPLNKNQKLYITGLHNAYNSGTFCPLKGVN